MSWSSIVTCGQQPGTRDSHSANLVGQKMIVFGGTNGSKKINDLHILDVETREWTHPSVQGKPPAPRESHSATLVEGNRLIIFGGSGEGEGNYLNDVHVLDLTSWVWSSPEVKGEQPAPRDSHAAATVGNLLIVYGGDCGDHYLGDVAILDLTTFTWSRLANTTSFSPGVRAGHVSVSIGTKLYVIGGVGDRAYCNDVWILDMDVRKWSHLDVGGPQPQGRFSHSALLADSSIVIYGGCGEDEHPLDEIVILQLGDEEYSVGPSVSISKLFGYPYVSEHRRLPGCRRITTETVRGERWEGSAGPPEPKIENFGEENLPAARMIEKIDVTAGGQPSKEGMNIVRMDPESVAESKPSFGADQDSAKRQRIAIESRNVELEPGTEQEDHSQSLSQQSSPPRSDQEHYQKSNISAAENSTQAPPFNSYPQSSSRRSHQPKLNWNHPHLQNCPLQVQPVYNVGTSPHLQPHQKIENVVVVPSAAQFKIRLPQQSMTFHAETQFKGQISSSVPEASTHNPEPSSQAARCRRNASSTSLEPNPPRVARAGIVSSLTPPQVGSEVRGIVDGVFDSGYLMTAQVNGQMFRGLLFSPGPACIGIDPNGATAASCTVSGNANPGIVCTHRPKLTLDGHSANPTRMNATLRGSPMSASLVGQPGNWHRSANIPPVAPGDHLTTTEGSGLHLGLTLRSPSANGTDLLKQVVGINTNVIPIAGGATREFSKGSSEGAPATSSESRIGATPLHGDAQSQPNPGVGNGHWVWHPVPPRTAVTEMVPMDDNARRRNVYFLAVPPLSSFSSVRPQVQLASASEMQATMVRSVNATGSPRNDVQRNDVKPARTRAGTIIAEKPRHVFEAELHLKHIEQEQ